MTKLSEDLFSPAGKLAIEEAIKVAEQSTSAEIRVFIEETTQGQNELMRAGEMFHTLKMDATEAQSGVLIYLAVLDRKFAIIGDKGIHEKVGGEYWNSVRDAMQTQFRLTHFTQGVIDAIHKCAEVMVSHYPRGENDENELSDEVIYG
ncbi:MAG: TPM domain-containing protein [Bacteroidota bacterium]|nr:TPM domain-containing protein [Bacteroidota bacterium]